MGRRAVSSALLAVTLVVAIAVASVAYFSTLRENGPQTLGATPTTQSPSTSSHTTSSGNPSRSSGSSCTPGAFGTVTVTALYATGFTPLVVNITVGQSITWTNIETGNYTRPHTVTLDNRTNLDPALAPGESVTCTFDHAGTFSYHCSFHPFMVGTINVKP